MHYIVQNLCKYNVTHNMYLYTTNVNMPNYASGDIQLDFIIMKSTYFFMYHGEWKQLHT